MYLPILIVILIFVLTNDKSKIISFTRRLLGKLPIRPTQSVQSINEQLLDRNKIKTIKYASSGD